ncbi:MAG: hypothetical protein JWN86_3622 [Planctomycetota bacterium]|nr:hypothetical protein [Planctomycetota bacterium]
MIRIRIVTALAASLFVLPLRGSPQAWAQHTAASTGARQRTTVPARPHGPAISAASLKSTQRERFLTLLVGRQDKAILRSLERRQTLLGQRLERLGSLPAKSPQQAKELARLEQQTGRRLQSVEREIADPPSSPLRQLFAQRQRALEQQARRGEARLKRLEGLVPTSPQQERQIARVERLWEQKVEQATGQVGFINRVLASPTVPGDSALAFASR